MLSTATPTEKPVLKPAVAQQRVANPAVQAAVQAVEADLAKLTEAATTVQDAPAAPEAPAATDTVQVAPPARPDGQPLVPTPPKQYKFVKLFCVAEELMFKDGSTFTFRLIMRNDGTGYAGSSFEVTTDETLANNLRETAKNPVHGVTEVI